MHLSAYWYFPMDYRQRVCPHGIETDGLPDVWPVYPSLYSFSSNTLPWIISLWCFPGRAKLHSCGASLLLGNPNREPPQCISNTPVRYVSCGKGKPASWNVKFRPQGFPGKSPHLIRVVFCLKNLPYPLCDLLESHRNETNGDRNTQKKTKDSRSSDLIQLGTHFTAPEAT